MKPVKYNQDRLGGPVYTDPELFEDEIEKIFHRTWVWVAHESEVVQSGDFKAALVGRYPVLVTRDSNRQLNVLLNRCRHRAASVCEVERGNAKSFVCPYHGWSYSLDGDLRGVPLADGYEGILDKRSLPLARLKVATYGGHVFASVNHDVEPLESFLGDARPWIDLFNSTVGAGQPLAVAGQHKLQLKGNWKILLENTTDFYHFPIVHKSFLAAVRNPEAVSDMHEQLSRPTAFCRALGNGHSVAVHTPDAATKGRAIPLQYEKLKEELASTCSPERVSRILSALGGAGFNLNLFPNIAMSGSFFRELRPIAVDLTEVRHVALAMDGVPRSVNLLRKRMFEQFQGPAGFGSPDDVEVWGRVQRGAQGSDDVDILLNRGLGREKTDGDGHATGQLTDETGMREAYAMWNRMMQQ
ncbi:MAG: Rieske 2Fe-2S domain-containing protein [Lautropia sp.]